MATTQDRINGLLGDLGVKPPVLVATTAPITLSGEQTIDGVAIVAEDRVLVKDQVDQTTNGIYYCQLSTWVRAPDFDGVRDCLQGTLVSVASGVTNARTLWALTAADPVIGTSNLTFAILTPLTPSAFIQTLLDDTTAAAARITLGAAALAGSSGQSFAVNNLTAAGVISGVSLSLSGGLSAAGAIVPSQTLGIVGTTTNNDAVSGSVGEYVSNTILSGSAIGLSTGIVTNIASMSLTAGNWIVYGTVSHLPAASTNITILQGSVSTASATIDPIARYSHRVPGGMVTGAGATGYTVPPQRLSLSVTTTVYLVALASFTVSTLAAYGQIWGVRIR